MRLQKRGWHLLALSGVLISCRGDGDTRSHDGSLSDAVLHWTPLPAPPRGSVRALALTHDGQVIAGSTGGLYVSRDQGVTWRSAGLESLAIDALAVTRVGTILAGTYRSGLLRSTDNGRTWATVGFERNVYLFSIAQDDDGSLYVSAAYGVDSTTPTGVFASFDDGRTWHAAGLREPHVFSLSVPYAASIFAGTDSGLYVTRDRGGHWSRIGEGLPLDVPVSTVIANGPTLLAATGMRQDAAGSVFGDGVFVSNDSGRTFTRFSAGMPTKTSVRALLLVGDTLLAATGHYTGVGGSGIYRYVGRGAWSQSGRKGDWIRGMVRLANGRVLGAANAIAIVRTDDFGRSWVQSADGFTNWEVTGLAVGSGNRLIVGSGRETFVSHDGGAHWIAASAAPAAVAFAVTVDGVLAAGLRGVVHWSSDGGATWSAHEIPGQSQNSIRSVAIDERGRWLAAIAPPKGALYQSDDVGRSWQELPLQRPKKAAEPWGVRSVTTTHSGAVIAGAENGIQRSDDRHTFTIVDDSTEAFALRSCGRDTVYVAAYERGLLRSTDDGRTWKLLTEALRARAHQEGYLTLMSVLCLGRGRLLVGGLEDGVFASEDNGSTWRQVNNGLRSTFVWNLAIDSAGQVFAATSAGVHRLSVRVRP